MSRKCNLRILSDDEIRKRVMGFDLLEDCAGGEQGRVTLPEWQHRAVKNSELTIKSTFQKSV